MGILFANNVNMQLAADLAADDTSFSVIAGQGSQCPEIAADSTDYMLLKIRNKNGLDEIVKIIEHELNSDTFIIGDSTAVPHTPSTDGRAYEKTLGGYQTALAIKASDNHKITMPVTAATLETALVVAGSGTTTDDFKKLHAITSTHTEINQLHESGVVKADLEKLHGITSTHTEINQLHGSGVVRADLEKLHGITSTHTEINQLHGSGVVRADLEKLHAITSTHTEINQLHGSGVVRADLAALHAASSTPTADTIAKFNKDGIMEGAELSMTGDAADEASAYEVTLALGSVKEGDVVFLQGYSRVGWSSAPTSINLSIGYKSGTSYLKYFNEETTPVPLQYLTAPIIPTGTASYGAISGIGTVDRDGTLVVRAFVSSSGGTSLTYQTKIRAFFLKKQ